MGFQKIIGQKEAIKFIKGSLKKERIANAYLFYGPEFSGRFTTAVEFAKGLNCKKGVGIPCDKCSACNKISKFEHPDVHLVFPPTKKGYFPKEIAEMRQEGKYFKFLMNAREIGIDTVRDEIIKETHLTPFEGRKKVFIISNAERMTVEASNAFLKVLEEPPSNTVFILISKSPKLLLPTISSRTQWVRFKPLSKKNNSIVLKKVFSKKIPENMEVAEEISIFMDKETNDIRKKIGNLLFLEPPEQRIINAQTPKSLDIEIIIYILYLFMYDILKVKFNAGDIVNKEYLNKIRQYAEKSTIEDIQNKIEILNESYQEYQNNVIPNEIMTNLMIRI